MNANYLMSRTSRTTFAIGSATAVAILLAGCGTSAGPVAVPMEQAPDAFAHIHALVGQNEDNILVATHEGIYSVEVGADATATTVGPIGGLDFDPMGFTVSEGVSYASGHPGPTTPSHLVGPNLGLIRSDDDGSTWRTVSLGGTTDFHSMTIGPGLENGPGVIYGLDSATGIVRRSLDDGLTWQDGATLEARIILADQADADVVFATTASGFATSSDQGLSFTVDTTAPALYLVAQSASGGLVGVDTAGALWERTDAGLWERGGTTTGVPQAMLADNDRIYVADDRGIAYTSDLGGKWVVPVVSG